MTSTIGIPIKLLNEAQNHVVTLEITSGQVYRGKLIEANCPSSLTTAEDNMNVQLKDITVTARDGRVSHLDQVYIRGSHVRFFIVPDMLRYPFPRTGSELPLTTPYYTTTLPIWHDNISGRQEWETEWLAPEAGEVVQSIGAWVFVVQKPSSARGGDDGGETVENIRSTLSTIHRVLSHHRETSNNYTPLDNEPLLLLICMPQPLRPLLSMTNDEWEDLCLDCGGWEWIDSEAKGKNEFGENVGLERLKEALEANEWDAGGINADNNIDDFETELGLRDESSTAEGIEVETDAPGMHEAILRHGKDAGDRDPEGDNQVEELESMMLRMQTIKEKAASMAGDERKRFAAKAVMEVMKSVESVN
ncbi:MAG: hypothetical protein Q9225_000662 [Loekoesia sp. 1 TL-2023]